MTALDSLPPQLRALHATLVEFVHSRCIPAEETYEAALRLQPSRWGRVPAVIEELKREARSLGLWNLFLPKGVGGGLGLSNAQYAPFCETMGWSPLAAEACNCSAPDSGNMETLLHFGTQAQQQRWLNPHLEGTMRSAFLMTEPRVASSDARNIATRIERAADGGYTISGRKWWATGALHPQCALFIVMGLEAGREDQPEHARHTILLVPSNSEGITVVRPLTTFGYDDAPHGHAEVRGGRWCDDAIATD